MSIVDADRGWRPAADVDVCVLGAGAAGITLALELGKRGRDCLVLEGGAIGPSAASQAIYAGTATGLPVPLDAARLRFFGGSTNHWTGICRPLDPIDLRSRAALQLPGWPIGYDELAAHYARAEHLVELPGSGWDAPRWLQEHSTAVLPTDPDLFETTIFRTSPPTRFGARYFKELDALESVVVAVNASALDLTLDRGRSVTSIQAVTSRGEPFEVRPRQVVVAMGGIENARFLLNAAHALPPGPQLDWIGAGFMEHPIYYRRLALVTSSSVLDSMTGYLPAPNGVHPRYLAMLATVPALRERRDMLGFAGRLSLPFAGAPTRPSQPAEIRGVASLLRFERAGAGDRLVTVEAWTEQAPDRRNRVVLGPGRDRFGRRRAALDWNLHGIDRESATLSCRLLGEELARLGLGRLGEMADDLVGQLMQPANHHMGTTRMSASADEGVVDERCRVHGTKNLYVAGSSVFPTGGYANPTLTIVALAVRLAQHLGALVKEISRRRFITGSTVAVALVAVASTGELAVAGTASGAQSLFDDPGGIRALGRRALDEGHPADLAKEVAGRDAAALRAAIAADVAASRWILIGGWTLARTEAALCVHEHLRRF